MTKELQCPDCSFMIRSEDEDQIVDMVQQHGKKAHDMDMSRSDIQGMIKTV